MSLSQAQLLKRKARKRKERTGKARSIQHESQLRYLSKWPVIFAYAPFNSGNDYTLQHVLIVRQCPTGLYAVGIFLIDTLCLGVKDCFMRVIPPNQFIDLLEKIEELMPMDAVSPSYVATFVNKAVDYAKNFGLEPHSDYQVIKKFLDGIPLDQSLTFNFGENGQPVYIAGPRDSPEFSNKVLKKLNDTVGKDHYSFIAHFEMKE